MERTKESDRKIMLALAVLSTVNETKEAPEGVLYAGLMGMMDLDGFQRIIGGLVETGLLVRRPGPCVAITEKGKIAAKAFDDTMKARAGTA